MYGKFESACPENAICTENMVALILRVADSYSVRIISNFITSLLACVDYFSESGDEGTGSEFRIVSTNEITLVVCRCNSVTQSDKVVNFSEVPILRVKDVARSSSVAIGAGAIMIKQIKDPKLGELSHIRIDSRTIIQQEPFNFMLSDWSFEFLLVQLYGDSADLNYNQNNAAAELALILRWNRSDGTASETAHENDAVCHAATDTLTVVDNDFQINQSTDTFDRRQEKQRQHAAKPIKRRVSLTSEEARAAKASSSSAAQSKGTCQRKNTSKIASVM